MRTCVAAKVDTERSRRTVAVADPAEGVVLCGVEGSAEGSDGAVTKAEEGCELRREAYRCHAYFPAKNSPARAAQTTNTASSGTHIGVAGIRSSACPEDSRETSPRARSYSPSSVSSSSPR